MDSVTRQLARDLKPGWHVEPVPNRLGRYFVVDEQGQKATVTDGSPIVIGKAETPKSISRLRGQLERAGAIERQHRRDASLDPHPHKPTLRAEKIPAVLAAEVLRDIESSPRERKLARAYLELEERCDKAMLLARRLADERNVRVA